MQLKCPYLRILKCYINYASPVMLTCIVSQKCTWELQVLSLDTQFFSPAPLGLHVLSSDPTTQSFSLGAPTLLGLFTSRAKFMASVLPYSYTYALQMLLCPLSGLLVGASALLALAHPSAPSLILAASFLAGPLVQVWLSWLQLSPLLQSPGPWGCPYLMWSQHLWHFWSTARPFIQLSPLPPASLTQGKAAHSLSLV